MKIKAIAVMMLVICSWQVVTAQAPAYIRNIFPEGTRFYENVPYAADTLRKHLLDIYVPPNAKSFLPVIVWIHGGAWFMNDKYADMGYMKNTLRSFMQEGFAVVSIDYRHSTSAVFPAQIQDCNQAIAYLYQYADQYALDKNKFVVMGFSAGAHLASLVGLAANQRVNEFYIGEVNPIKIKAVVDFYGPVHLLMFHANQTPVTPHDPITMLLGASPLLRPDLSERASPASYIDKNDPPFFIVHGEKDDSVPSAQSYLLQSLLTREGVKNELFIVKDAPHYGDMFDTPAVQTKLLAFLRQVL